MLFPIQSSTLKTMGLMITLLALLITGFQLYQTGKRAGELKGALEKKEAEVALLTSNLATKTAFEALQKEAFTEDQIEASKAFLRLTMLKQKVDSLEDYIATLEGGSNVCLDRTDTDRVRDLLTAPDSPSSGNSKAPSGPK